ncbi:MAG: formate dehydrogenase accessory sulfurtransferase FdhD [Promethearchaeota archaeon]|nr:MAG: formate dehydrogenase accessory sulfurtransferase FdhD [Candidatus Lokiarchaeota archaeon]
MNERKVNITRIVKDEKYEEIDVVLIESPIDILIDSEPIANIICLPSDLKELAVGFLFSIGIIDSYSEIERIDVNELEGTINIKLKNKLDMKSDIFDLNPVSRVIDTTCGIPSPWRKIIKDKIHDAKGSKLKENNFKLRKEIILSSILEMQKQTHLFRKTGGCHGAAIFDSNGRMLAVKEDIGRHNAIDKVIGALLMINADFNNVFLTSTGRLTGDSVLKAIRAKIPLVASLSAAIESGIRLAFAYELTLIGFVRGSKMNIYTRPDRVII